MHRALLRVSTCHLSESYTRKPVLSPTSSRTAPPPLSLGPHLNMASRSSSLYLKFSCLLTVYNFIVCLSDVIHLEYSDGWIDSSSLSVTCMHGMLSVGVLMTQSAFMGQRMTFR